MNKRGVEHPFFFAMEIVLGMLVAGILISIAVNFDSVSNINKAYAEEDLALLVESIQASPGSIEYNYKIKSSYKIDIQKENILVNRNEEFLAGYQYENLTLEKEQGKEQIRVGKE